MRARKNGNKERGGTRRGCYSKGMRGRMRCAASRRERRQAGGATSLEMLLRFEVSTLRLLVESANCAYVLFPVSVSMPLVMA